MASITETDPERAARREREEPLVPSTTELAAIDPEAAATVKMSHGLTARGRPADARPRAAV